MLRADRLPGNVRSPPGSRAGTHLQVALPVSGRLTLRHPMRRIQASYFHQPTELWAEKPPHHWHSGRCSMERTVSQPYMFRDGWASVTRSKPGVDRQSTEALQAPEPDPILGNVLRRRDAKVAASANSRSLAPSEQREPPGKGSNQTESREQAGCKPGNSCTSIDRSSRYGHVAREWRESARRARHRMIPTCVVATRAMQTG